MLKFSLIAGLVMLQITLMALAPTSLSGISLIPKPVSITSTDGHFSLTSKSIISYSNQDKELKRLGDFLAERLRPATGFALTVQPTGSKQIVGNISISLSSGDPLLGDEGYLLTIKSDRVNLIARKPAGIFNGIQTLRQLFPAKIECTTKQSDLWQIPAGEIRDFPEYAYRGAMLDVARHFFQIEDVKRYIDLIALYKMNILHLHLSDDQGWRIEIKKWPKLTSVGGSLQVGGGKGGFYTQEQYKEIINYAAARFIVVIPEIDMPGHTNAALASYPELNCNDQATALYTGTEVGFSSLCTKKPITYQFIADVFGEIASITPGPYLHIGGDESHVTKLEDYIPFVNMVQEIVVKLGKQVIGWDEIALSSLKPNSFVQYWAEAENAVLGVRKGAKVIMSPADNCYLDMQYDSTTTLGLHWSGFVEVDKSYNWDPATLVKGISKENIAGVEAPLWTETMVTMSDIEYMAFPRLLGIADIGWRSPSSANWNEYKIRLGNQKERLKLLKINFYPSKQIPWAD